MRIIFLDVDGVLNTQEYLLEQCEAHPEGRYFSYNAHKNFNPKVLENLARIVNNKPDTFIVISSTWRLPEMAFNKWFEDKNSIQDEQSIPDRHWDALIKNLSKFGLKEKIIGVTPNIHCAPRGAEIKAWLRQNSNLNIHSFVILDDDSDMEDLLDSHTVLCNNVLGITEENTELAIYILNNSKFPQI